MIYNRGQLKEMGMKELRVIGNLYDVKDTSKKELIEEIMLSQPSPEGASDTDNLIRDLDLSLGDAIRTYDLRERLKEALVRLKRLEIKGGN